MSLYAVSTLTWCCLYHRTFKHSSMKFNVDSVPSYNSIHPVYQYTEQFNNNHETYRDGTNWFGILLAFLSGAFFTISSGLVKAISNVNPMILLGIRSILQIVVMLIISIIHKRNVFGPKGSRLLIHSQGMVGGMTLALLYYSFRKLPIGDATTIIFSSPVIVITLSYLFLKEPCGILRIIVICALSAGVILVSKPPFLFQMHRTDAPYDVMGYVCAILAAFFTALNIVIMRKCSDIHYSVIVANLSTWVLISAISFFFILSDANQHHQIFPKGWRTWCLIIAVAVTGLAGQILVTKALKIEGAGKVSVTRSLDIILAYIIQVFFFDDIPNSTSIIGAILILFAVISMGFEKEVYGICDYIP